MEQGLPWSVLTLLKSLKVGAPGVGLLHRDISAEQGKDLALRSLRERQGHRS